MSPLVRLSLTMVLAVVVSAPTWAVTKDGNLTIGLIAKTGGNPVSQVVLHGAQQAALDLGQEYGIKIKIEDATPLKESAQSQAEAIEKFVLDGVDGVAIDCSDTREVGTAIDDAVQAGLLVATYDSDAPASKRFFCFSTDNDQCGHTLMIQLAAVMKGKGPIAILSGNPNAENLRRRVNGIKAAAALYSGISIRGVYYCNETPAGAAARVAAVMKENPDIAGWAMVGSWGLSTSAAFPWAPGKVRCASMGLLPTQLAPIRDRHVDLVVAQPYFQWGYRAVERIILKAAVNRRPPEPIESAPLEVITSSNVNNYGKLMSTWLTKKDEAENKSEYVVPRPH